MWNFKTLRRIDLRLILLLMSLMIISLLVISSTTLQQRDFEIEEFFTPYVKNQLQWFGIGWLSFLFFSAMDYHKLRQWAWILYLGMILSLVGLFFVPAIQHVHRWYRIGGSTFQPSEQAKLIVVISLSWFLEYKATSMTQGRSSYQAIAMVLLPFLLILKQPDLGTALVLFPIALVLFYFAGMKRRILWVMSLLAIVSFIFMSLLFLGVISHEGLRPYATKIIKEYQYERLNPDTYHQKAAQIAISLGGVTGSGWHKSEFTGRQWLPAAHTDSVFPAYAEEFGLIGVALLLGLFFCLIYCSFQVTAVAKDLFGRLLSAGITTYLAVHIVLNLGMMSGFLPITGVPLILVSYGGSSVLSTMSALGILQSIYSRRFLF
jgi:rod shape determining protein RodA